MKFYIKPLPLTASELYFSQKYEMCPWSFSQRGKRGKTACMRTDTKWGLYSCSPATKNKSQDNVVYNTQYMFNKIKFQDHRRCRTPCHAHAGSDIVAQCFFLIFIS